MRFLKFKLATDTCGQKTELLSQRALLRAHFTSHLLQGGQHYVYRGKNIV